MQPNPNADFFHGFTHSKFWNPNSSTAHILNQQMAGFFVNVQQDLATQPGIQYHYHPLKNQVPCLLEYYRSDPSTIELKAGYLKAGDIWYKIPNIKTSQLNYLIIESISIIKRAEELLNTTSFDLNSGFSVNSEIEDLQNTLEALETEKHTKDLASSSDESPIRPISSLETGTLAQLDIRSSLAIPDILNIEDITEKSLIRLKGSIFEL